MVENLFNLIEYKKVNPLEEDRRAWNVTPRPDEVHSTCNCRGTYVHQVPL